jgi:hypothetical protein
VAIHIGLHKTGTTSLQSFFAGHRDGISKSGLYYPVSGCIPSEGAHHNIYRHYSETTAEKARFDPARGGMPELLAELTPVTTDTFLSSEGLWVLARDEPNRFRQLFSDMSSVREPIFLLTWRNAAEYCESLYFQNAKNHQMPSIERAVRWFHAIPDEFERVVSLVTMELGAELIIIPYGKDMIGRFTDLFRDRFGIKIDVNLERKADVNPSMSTVHKVIAAHLSTLEPRVEPDVYLQIIKAFNSGIKLAPSEEHGSIMPENVQENLIKRSVQGLSRILKQNKKVSLYPEGIPQHFLVKPYLLNMPAFLCFEGLKSKLEDSKLLEAL